MLSISPAGRQMLRNRQDTRGRQLEKALSTGFTQSELGQLTAVITLLDRLAAEM